VRAGGGEAAERDASSSGSDSSDEGEGGRRRRRGASSDEDGGGDESSDDDSFSSSDGCLVIENVNWAQVCDASLRAAARPARSLSAVRRCAQCDRCNKWRRLPPSAEYNPERLPAKWYCEMNPNSMRNACDRPEERLDADEDCGVWESEPARRARQRRAPPTAHLSGRTSLRESRTRAPPPAPPPATPKLTYGAEADVWRRAQVWRGGGRALVQRRQW
jgi:hypothetical protein